LEKQFRRFANVVWCANNTKQRERKIRILSDNKEFLDDISVNYVGPINSQWEKGCILVTVDRLSHFVLTITTKTTLGSKETFLKLENHIFIPYGKYLKRILSDRVPQFRSGIWTNLLKKENISCSLASVFYAPGDGLVKRAIQDVLQKLHFFSATQQKSWILGLETVTDSINSSPSNPTSIPPTDIESKFKNTTKEILTQYKKLVDQTKSNIEKYNNDLKTKEDKFLSDKYSYSSGQFVWISFKLQKPIGPDKIGPRYFGPYQILKSFNNVNQKLDMQNQNKENVYHVKFTKAIVTPIDFLSNKKDTFSDQ
jgi:hypothetical protein